jgi:parallel beta-helix repeat protein
MLARTPLLPVVVVVAMALPSAARAVGPGSQLIDCSQADTLVKPTGNVHLDPSCTWTRGVQISTSNVEVDCQGAHIVTTDRRYGIEIVAPTDVALTNVTVRNCRVEGFLNDLHVQREGFRDLAPGVEYENGFSNILVEDSTFVNSRGVGVYVNGYVTGVTLRRIHVERTGSSGIYLETGSTGTVVEDSTIVNNGYEENGPSGQIFSLGGIDFWFWGTGREGISIDGSRFNTIRNNHFEGNSAGGILLYKNCGEYYLSRPDRWFDRRYGAHQNLIEHNTFVGGGNGVWVASRMGQNTFPMECSDPQYLPGISLDSAKDNVLRGNTFTDVQYGIRIEDDRTTVEDNVFTGSDASEQAVLVGTKYRTSALDQPVAGTTITGNSAAIAGNLNPYRWLYGHIGTTFDGNTSLGREVGLCEGVEPFQYPFVMTVAVVAYDPENPPPSEPPAIPDPPVLPPCPITCAAPSGVAHARLAVRQLDTPPGDEILDFRGQVVLPQPFTPVLDPVAVGVGVVVADAHGARVVDVLVPGGAYDAATRVGWTAAPRGGSWRYVNRSAAPVGGITSITVRDASRKTPGLVKFRVTGRGTVSLDPSALPLSAIVALDPPTAETGQCGTAAFPGPSPACTSHGSVVRCR